MEKSKIIKIAAVALGIALIGFMIVIYTKKGHYGDEMSRAQLLDEESLSKDDGKQVFLIPKEDVSKFSITDANGIVLEFEYSGEHWQYVDEKELNIDEDRIDKVLNYICDVRCIGTLTNEDGEKYGLNQDSIEYRVTDSAGSTIIISIGNYDVEKKELYFAINYDFATIYANSGKLSKVSEYTASDLIVLPIEETP